MQKVLYLLWPCLLFETNTVRSAASDEGQQPCRFFVRCWPGCSHHCCWGTSVARRQQGTQDVGLSMGASASRPQAFRVVQQRHTPVMPGIQDPMLFHNVIQAALAPVFRHNAGQDCPRGVFCSGNHPSASGAADALTVRLSPHMSKNPLSSSHISLESCTLPGNTKELYLPEGSQELVTCKVRSEAAPVSCASAAA